MKQPRKVSKLEKIGFPLFTTIIICLLVPASAPLIGVAGVSAVPMAARVAQTLAREEDKHNFILMQAMGPNVAGVIGTVVAAGLFISMLS